MTQSLAKQVLAEKGLELHREPYRRKVSPIRVLIDPKKTALMLRLEAYYGASIQDLIDSKHGSMLAISVRLNVSPSTICKWRRKLNMNGSV